MQHGLCWNAAHIEAGAAEMLFLHQRYFAAQLRRPNCRNVAARAATDYKNFFLFAHNVLLITVGNV